MNCMKCGREIKADQVFCDSCLADMEKYPVKPDVAVQIPRCHEDPAPKKMHIRKRQPPTAEEQLATMKKRMRRMLAVMLVMLLLIVGLSVVAGATIRELDVQKLLGRNYSTIIDGEPVGESAD